MPKFGDYPELTSAGITSAANVSFVVKDAQSSPATKSIKLTELQTAIGGGAGVTNGDKGDITVSSGGATWTIDTGAVSLAKIVQIGTDKLLGRFSAGTGTVEELTCTDFAQSLLDDTSAAVARSTLGFTEADATTFGLSVLASAGSVDMPEIASPGAPAANTARLYCEDNGSGKSRLVVRFPTGAVQVIATEP